MPDTPERIYHVSTSQLSIARHYGGIKFNGVDYVYDPTTDTLIRADVLMAGTREEIEERRIKKAAAKAKRRAAQQSLFEE